MTVEIIAPVLKVETSNPIINVEMTTPIMTIATAGVQGLSAYQLALNNGFIGTEIEWVDSLSATGMDMDISYWSILQ